MSSSAMYGQPAGTMCPTLTTWQPHHATPPGEPPSVPLSPRDCTFVHLRYEPIVPPRCLIHQPLTTTLFLLQLSPDAILASVWFKHPPTPHYGCWLFFPRCLIVADLVENALPCNLIVLACEIYFFFNQKLLLVLFWITLCNWSLVEPQQWWWAAWNLKKSLAAGYLLVQHHYLSILQN